MFLVSGTGYRTTPSAGAKERTATHAAAQASEILLAHLTLPYRSGVPGDVGDNGVPHSSIPGQLHYFLYFFSSHHLLDSIHTPANSQPLPLPPPSAAELPHPPHVSLLLRSTMSILLMLSVQNRPSNFTHSYHIQFHPLRLLQVIQLSHLLQRVNIPCGNSAATIQPSSSPISVPRHLLCMSGWAASSVLITDGQHLPVMISPSGRDSTPIGGAPVDTILSFCDTPIVILG
ncbi:hypothetical protein E2C01_029184 [Portunus trituberculatus]|uniref:Uncharacterized protein n=1 Tax=Portunus trituberculatus TaxID=210409 RepID=A0A5B7EMD6_PORTR|nr:hypothetical protein [Portunus trituberculatus]